MGCGNSTATSAGGGPSEGSKDVTEESSPEEEKRKNYGGVYIGVPTDPSSVAAGQSTSMQKG
ncbi:overexpressed in colon carcinoma 1 protein homolog [Engraulis encrasicolus]|uniref:overexpressed in colon carcinoma 1 protein homolog n=1 Tax=Engraulis encrasicolus TaxID=184585 RepID=UPI002FD6C4A3